MLVLYYFLNLRVFHKAFKEILISELVLGFWTFGFAPSVASAPGIISTVAGNGNRGFSGDGGPATEASLSAPRSVFVDGSGVIYIAANLRIRKVDTSANISTVAGNGIVGSSGDGGSATEASVRYPSGVFVDGSGNIYIADRSRIRKVDTSGIVSTVAGSGNHGFSGDGGPATEASVRYPTGVFVDGSGNIYIADTNNIRIRKVDTSGIISTVAGNGTRGFSGDGGLGTSASLENPTAVFVDGSRNIYIADCGNHRIRKVDTSGIISTVAGNGTRGFSGDGGLATSASLNFPQGVFVDGLGNIYIGDTANHRIRKVEGILVGDFDGDNEVGLSDFVLFLDVFGTMTSSDEWNPTFDLDGKGEVGLSDFVIFLDNFGSTG